MFKNKLSGTLIARKTKIPFTIFISSPGDVQAERDAAAGVVNALRDNPEFSEVFDITYLKWEEHAGPLAGLDPQANINEYVGRPARTDLVVCIFGRRFGQANTVRGRPIPSGTYYEFVTSLRSQRANRDGRPFVFLFRRIMDAPLSPSGDEITQFERVEAFFNRRPGSEEIDRGIEIECRSTEEFAKVFDDRLKRLLRKLKEPNDKNAQLSLPKLPAPTDESLLRDRMIERVRSDWIKGLWSDIVADVVKPFDVMYSNSAGDVASGTANLLRCFDDAGKRLIILGSRGAGKTFLMLDLLSMLLNRAKDEPTDKIPVVFNLSSWAAMWKVGQKHEGDHGRELFERWLVNELVVKYRVTRTTAKDWIDGEKLCLFLDGLDDITIAGIEASERAAQLTRECRQDCVNAISELLQHTLYPLVFCCQTEAYESLENKLDIRRGPKTTVRLLDLTEAQVQEYLESSVYNLASLTEVIKRDKILREMARTPFLLTTMAVVYDDKESSVEAIESVWREATNDTEKRAAIYKDLMKNYQGSRLTHYDAFKGRQAYRTRRPFPHREIRKYLHILAEKMDRDDASQFLVEQLQPNWLKDKDRWLYKLGVGLLLLVFLCLVAGMPVAIALGYEWMTSPGADIGTGLRHGIECFVAEFFAVSVAALGFALSKGWKFGVVLGLTLGLVRGFETTLSYVDGGLHHGVRAGLITALAGAVVLGLFFNINAYKRDTISPLESRSFEWKRALTGALLGILVGGVFWLAFGPARGIGFGLALIPVLFFLFGDLGTGFEPKTRVNQAIRQSAYTAVSRGIIAGVFGSLCFGASYGIVLGQEHGRVYGETQGVVNFVLGFGLSVVALGFGAIPVFQHIALRWALYKKGLTPKNFENFLNFCHEMQLLRRVGGTFMFQHKVVRDYYRDLTDIG